MQMKRTTLYAIGGVALAAAIGAFALGGGKSDATVYKFAAVDRGDVVSTISTSGTLGAVVQVDVSSQVSGQIAQLNVDFNSPVKKGDVIARLDPQTYEARLRQSDAELAVARANLTMQRASVGRTQADLLSARANLENIQFRRANAERELTRREELVARGVGTVQARDTARTELESLGAQANALRAAIAAAEAQVKMADAQVENAAAAVQQREAALTSAKIDLERTIIRAPVDGTVINRAVNLGQTVAASLNAPVLFVIAQDLKAMQVEADVDEADIGRVRPGLPVTFTVDAFAGRNFRGSVQQVRQLAEKVQNVVTYTVVVSADNTSGELLPGMTANVQIVLDQRNAVLRVPNATLRFRPPGATPAPASGGAIAGGPPGAAGGPPGAAQPAAARSGAGGPPGAAGQGGAAQGELVNRLIVELSLNAAQQEQLRAIGAEAREAAQRLRSQGAGREELAAEAQRSRAAFNERLRGILTEEQKVKFAALQQEQRPGGGGGTNGRVWVLDEKGQPKALAVRYGATNGSMTEILSGELKEGQQVIVAATAPPARNAGLTGIRF